MDPISNIKGCQVSNIIHLRWYRLFK